MTARNDADPRSLRQAHGDRAHVTHAFVQALLKGLPGSAVFVLDEDLRYEIAEGEGLQVAGRVPADFVGRTIHEIAGEGDSASLALLRAALRGQPFVTEHDVDGRRFVSHGVPFGGPDGDRVLVLSLDATDRLASEGRWSFLVRLNDRLRLEREPDAIQDAAATALGEHLKASRVGYAEDLGDGEGIVVVACYAAGVPAITGRYRYEDYDSGLPARLTSGETIVRPDVANDPDLTLANKLAHAGLGAASVVAVPLVKDGRLLALMFVHQDRPRQWLPDELQLVADVAERTWSVVERARAEQALREGEQKYRSVFTSIDDGFCICEMVLDESGVPVDYRFLEANPRFEEMTGLAGAVGRTAYELVPDLEPHWVETYARVALEGKAERFESGSEVMGRWFDVYTTPVEPYGRFAIVFKDITARRTVELALRESEDRFRRTVEALPQSVWVSHADGTLEFVNSYWVSYSGLDLAATQDPARLSAAIHPDDREEMFRRWGRCLEAGEPFEMEARLRRADGDFRWFLVRTVPLREGDGDIGKWYGVGTEIHALRQAEAAAEEARGAVERSDARLRRLQQLTAELAGALTPEEVVAAAATRLAELLSANASWAALSRSHPSDLATVLADGLNPRLLSRSVAAPTSALPTAVALAADRPLMLETRAEVEQLLPAFAESSPQICAAVLLPLRAANRPLGSVCTFFDAPQSFSAADHDVTMTVARLTSAALARASEYATEHQAAALLQESLLVDPPRAVDGAVIAVRYQPAAEEYKVGGDWYDVTPLADGRLGLSVGDVVGSGITAATVMGQLRSAGSAIAMDGAAPREVLARLDDFARRVPGALLATTTYATVDLEARRLVHCSAGHPPPLVVEPDGTASFLWAGRGTPLGLADGVGPPQSEVVLAAGSRLVLYSDGLVERRGEAITTGLERLRALAGELRPLSIERFADLLLERMLTAPSTDDVVLLGLDLSPPAADTLELGFHALPRELAGARRRLRAWMSDQAMS